MLKMDYVSNATGQEGHYKIILTFSKNNFYSNLKRVIIYQIKKSLIFFKMQKINLVKIIEEKGIDPKELASKLFPQHKFPSMALDRVISGESAPLNADQISLLANLLDCSISDLFSRGRWKAVIRKGIRIFTWGDYQAELNLESEVTKIYHKKSLFHESILHTQTIPLDEYFENLEEIVTKYEKQCKSK